MTEQKRAKCELTFFVRFKIVLLLLKIILRQLISKSECGPMFLDSRNIGLDTRNQTLNKLNRASLKHDLKWSKTQSLLF
jgi:hypothetical protein